MGGVQKFEALVLHSGLEGVGRLLGDVLTFVREVVTRVVAVVQYDGDATRRDGSQAGQKQGEAEDSAPDQWGFGLWHDAIICRMVVTRQGTIMKSCEGRAGQGRCSPWMRWVWVEVAVVLDSASLVIHCFPHD